MVVLIPNVAEYATLALGIMAAGGVFSGANPNCHASEIKSQVEAADARIIVTDGSTYRKVSFTIYTPFLLLVASSLGLSKKCDRLSKMGPNKYFYIRKIYKLAAHFIYQFYFWDMYKSYLIKKKLLATS